MQAQAMQQLGQGRAVERSLGHVRTVGVWSRVAALLELYILGAFRS